MTTSQQDGTMIDKMAQFDLLKEIADSEQKKPWQSGHNARTLFKKHDFRIVLITMEDAARMKQHHADGTISIQVLKGQIRVTKKPYRRPSQKEMASPKMAPAAQPMARGQKLSVPFGMNAPAATMIAVPGNNRLKNANDSPNAKANMTGPAQAACRPMKSTMS